MGKPFETAFAAPPQPARPVPVTFFGDRWAKTKREATNTLPELVDLIRRTKAPSKNELPLWKFARFGDARTDKGSLRHNDNVICTSGAEGDYDGEQVPAQAAAALLEKAGVEAIIYTSPSHTPEKPRWRVVCPFSRELPPAQRTRMLERVNGLLGGILAGESWVLSQSFYYGSVEGRPAAEIYKIVGTPIDQHGELDAGAIGKSGNGHAADDTATHQPANDALSGLPPKLFSQPNKLNKHSRHSPITFDEVKAAVASIPSGYPGHPLGSGERWRKGFMFSLADYAARNAETCAETRELFCCETRRIADPDLIARYRKGPEQYFAEAEKRFDTEVQVRAAGGGPRDQVHAEALIHNTLGNNPGAVTEGWGGRWDGLTGLMRVARAQGAFAFTTVGNTPAPTLTMGAAVSILPTTDQSLVAPNTYPRPRMWLYGTTILLQQVTVLSGPGGIGKSLLALTVAVDLAIGGSLLGEKVFGPRTVLYINLEDPADEISRRLRGIEQHYGISPSRYTGRLHTAARGAIIMRLIIADPKTREPVVNTALLTMIEQAVKRLHVEVLVFDPLGRLVGADINVHRVADLLLATLNDLAERCKIAILIVAHVRKGGRADTDGAAATLGSTAIIDGARIARGLDRATPEDAVALGWFGEPWRLIGQSSTKDNDAPPSAREWFELRTVTLPNGAGPYPGDQTAVLVPYTPPAPGQRITDDMRKAAMSVVSAGMPDDHGVRVPLCPGTRGGRNATEHIAKELRRLHGMVNERASRVLARDVLRDLLDRGFVVETDVKLPRYSATGAKAGSQPPRKGLEARWERTPWSTDDQAAGSSGAASDAPPAPPAATGQEDAPAPAGASRPSPATRSGDPQQ